MRKLLILMIVEILLLQGFSTASTLSDFGTGQKEVTASLRSPEYSDVINITLPAECHVLAATMNVSAVTPDEAFPDGPVNASVVLGNNVLYSFNGTGYGGLGKQTLFNNGDTNANFEFGIGGGNVSPTVRLPKSAVAQSASMNVRCQGPEKGFELWNRTGAPGDYADFCQGVGDVNNDGYDDFTVSSAQNDTYGSGVGLTYFFYGKSTLHTTEDLIFSSNTSPGCFDNVAGVGDLNGDGYDDIAIGSIYDNIGAPEAGAVFVYFGGDPMDNVPDLILKGDHYNQLFGYYISGKIDLNNDGFDDLVLTSEMDWGNGELGQVSVYYGSKNMSSTPDLIITSPEPYNAFGILATYASDLNADGYDDLAIGAQGMDTPQVVQGKVYIYYGGQNMDNVSDMVLWENLSWYFFGGTVSGGGDINGDGYDDLIVSASEYYWLYPDLIGKVYVYYGGPDFDNRTDLIINGAGGGDFFGWSVIAGDVNGDGFDDLLITAPENKTNGNNSGAWYLFYGGKNMDTIPDYTYYGNAGEYTGLMPTSAGDVNNDGHDEIMVSAWADNITFNGRVSIYFDWKSGLLNSSVNVAAEQIWFKDGYFNGTNLTTDFTDALNTYLNNSVANVVDAFGNSFVDIPINLSAECDGNFTLSNLSIVYSYTTPTLEFSDALNKYILSHKGEKDTNGNITIPIKVTSDCPGKLKLSDLRLDLDQAPEFTANIPDSVMNEDTVVSDLVDLQQYFNDDNDQAGQLNYQVVSFTNDTIVNVSIAGNRYLSMDALTGSQNDNWTGTVDVVVKTSDRWNSTTVSNQFQVTIQNVPDPPEFISQPPTNATAGIEYQYLVMAIDGDNDPLNYVLVEKPLDMTMNPQTGLITWIPYIGGDFSVSIMVSDGHFNVFQNFSINVPNQVPKINSTPNVTAIKGVPYDYTVNASDADGDSLTFSLVSDVSGMTIDAQKGNLSWTPESTGDFTIKIMVADDKGGTAIQEFLVHVYEKIEPKIDYVSLPDKVTVEGKVTVSGKIIKGSLDVVTVQYRLDSGEWVNLTGNESWEVNLDTTKLSNGNHTLVIRVYDGQTYSEVATRSFTVNNPVKETEQPFPTLMIGILLVLFVAAVILLFWKGKKPPDEEEE